MVIVVGLVIFSGGYFINDSRKVAKQAKEDSQTQTETKQDDLATVEPEVKDAQEPEPEVEEKVASDDSADEKKTYNDDSEEKEKPEYESVEIEAEYEGTTVTVEVETNKAGKCYIFYKTTSGEEGTKEGALSNGKCVFTGVKAEGNITAKFMSNDGTQFSRITI